MAIQKRVREDILEKQCAYYIRQIKKNEEWIEELRKYRHNMKQHYILENIYLENKDYEALRRYCNKNLSFLDNINNVSNSGNSYIDSIVNYKADLAKKEDIRFVAEVQAPCDAEMNAEDICICLGNLLDNAIEAVKELQEEKAVHVWVRADGANLAINIKNPYQSVLRKKEGCYLTNKKDSMEHGLGLLSVQQIVEKYKGSMIICDDNNVFDVMILMYGFLEKKESAIKELS